MAEPLIKVEDLRLSFETTKGRFMALNGVNLEISEGEVVGVVGESGCGKSSLALSIIGLLPTPPARILDGSEVSFKGRNLLGLSEEEMEKTRGSGVSMIFQEPLSSLNPVFTIGNQVGEAVRIGLERRSRSHTNRFPDEIRKETVAWLKKVALPDPEKTLKKYPHELSGGMSQRVMIAIALAAQPALMLADEPTSALDVTTQNQILKLIRSIIKQTGTAVLFISHDLAVVAQIADRVAVMYAGLIVEEAPVLEIFERPLHPYTQALLAAFPTEDSKGKHLETISGNVPSLLSMPLGCPFQPRCKFALEACRTERPLLEEASPGHKVACILY